MVAGYVDGIYAWNQSGWDRFPNATKIRIAISATTNDGHVLDVETGDASPNQAPGWAKMRLASGLSSVAIYMNRNTRPAVEAALQSSKLLNTQVCLWVATDDGTLSVPTGYYGVVAVQYANSTLSGGHYDLSNVPGFWPGVDIFGPGGGSLGETMVIQQARALMQLLWWVCRGGTAPTPDIRDGGDGAGVPGANNVLLDGSNADLVATQVMTLPDVQKRMSTLNAVIAAGPAQPFPDLSGYAKTVDVESRISQAINSLPAPIVPPTPSLWEVLKATFAAPSK